jgi:hypothetical protein
VLLANRKNMLNRLTKGVAARIGALLAALALAGFVAPPIAVAFVPTPAAIHCLAATDHKAHSGAQDRVSHSGDVDHGKRSGDSPSHRTTCCGMFNVTALAPDSAPAILRQWTDPAVSMFIEADFHTLAPEQPNRPPISRLSL